MKRFAFVIIGSALITGCANAPTASGLWHQPLVDTQRPGYDAGRFGGDVYDCNQIAGQRPSGVGDGAAGGLLMGAVLGAIVGNALGDTGGGAAYGAAFGGVSGAAQGGAEGVSRHTRIVQDCMRGRGYTVLD